jgi:hypothetical protein
MKLLNSKLLIILIVLILFGGFLIARSVDGGGASKKFDLVKYHNVGNIWLRVSNYGFFGSGDDIQPQWPSLEYPGGSAIDYLYQGALWFGAKKIRRNAFGEKLYWIEDDPTDPDDCIPASHPDWTPDMKLVVDTLTTVGFDGDADLYEFLPAYNPLETTALGTQYSQYNVVDTIMTASIRNHRRGVDDDGDGLIDEDPVGYAFPLRTLENGIPMDLEQLGGRFIADFTEDDVALVEAYSDIWYPLGFADLSYNGNTNYNFCEVNDDDNDGLFDEDGFPVSEQDFISFYYDYSPFGTSGERDWGGSSNGNNHGDSEKLNIRVRQLSYQWSYDYIKNLVYVEFNITNMNPVDTLFDCAMGIYMDSDVGPQAYDGDTRSLDDISSYVPGEGYEFAYTFDADGDNGLTTGLVGSRVCTPDPEQLEFACWYWNRGDGPDDSDPLDLNPANLTANEKYWLLTNKNPNPDDYISLRDDPTSQMDEPDDTRYLFAFYGDMQGMTNPTEGSWNLAPGKTMKIVIAVFPGNDLTELKTQAVWAKDIYENPQNLYEVILPDTFVHYQAPEPPAIPNMYAEMDESGNSISLYWDNRSQLENIDTKTVPNENVGWQDMYPNLDSYVGKYDEQLAAFGYFPEEFAPYDASGNPIANNWNPNGIVNPWTGFRLRHDFQGYAVWSRSGSGSQEYWMLQNRWDKKDTDQDYLDYEVNIGEDQYKYFGGSGTDWSKDLGLPNPAVATDYDTNYYKYNEFYTLVPYEVGEEIYGMPIYDHEKKFEEIPDDIYSWSFNDQALWFKNPSMRDDLYLALYDDRLIPLEGHLGQNNVVNGIEDEDAIKDRLARRYYQTTIMNPPKGIEYYISITAWDRGIPSVDLLPLESGRDGNMKIFFPGPSASTEMDNIYVVPNPYVGQSDFDGRRSNDEKGDRSRRIWFVNIPERCTIKIFTLAGDLVDKIEHDGAYSEDIISVSKAAASGIAPSGMATWDLLSKHNQIIAPGVYLFSVKNKDNGDIKVGKFVIIK